MAYMKVGLATQDWASVTINGVDAVCLRGPGWIRFGQYAVRSQLNLVLGRLIWIRQKACYGILDPDNNVHVDCNIIIAQRCMGKDEPERIKQTTANGQVFVLDIDDWYWGLRPESHAFKYVDPDQNPDFNLAHFKDSVTNASAVVLSTPSLADKIDWIDWNKKYLHENHIDIEQYSRRFQDRTIKPIIGWTGVTSLRPFDLEVLEGFYPDIVDEFDFHHTGSFPTSPPFAGLVGLAEEKVSITPELWTGDYQKAGFEFDIGVVPLANIPFNESKSWLKGLEYAAAGIPFVASAVGEYKRFKELYSVGRLAENRSDWIGHLCALRSHGLREKEAAENLEKVRSLDISVGVEKWDSLIEALGQL